MRDARGERPSPLRFRDPHRQTLTLRFDGGRTVIVPDGDVHAASPLAPPPVDAPAVEASPAPAPASLKAGRDKSSAPLASADARWILATCVQQRLRGATLAPADRDEIVTLGKTFGFTPFQANLIIAIVQDQARHRAPMGEAAGLLAMVPAARPTASGGWRVAVWCAAALAGEALLIAMFCL